MSDNIQDDFENNLLNANGIDAIIIEGTDGKEYRIEKKLPTKAGNIFNQYMGKYGFEEPETADEIKKKSDMSIEYTVATLIAANEKKNPELTARTILGYTDKTGKEVPGIFTEYEIGQIFSLYLVRWLEIANRKLKSQTEEKNKKKEPEGGAV